jgi:hypothetical protein
MTMPDWPEALSPATKSGDPGSVRRRTQR